MLTKQKPHHQDVELSSITVTDTGTQKETFTIELTITRKPQHMFITKLQWLLKHLRVYTVIQVSAKKLK